MPTTVKLGRADAQSGEVIIKVVRQIPLRYKVSRHLTNALHDPTRDSIAAVRDEPREFQQPSAGSPWSMRWRARVKPPGGTTPLRAITNPCARPRYASMAFVSDDAPSSFTRQRCHSLSLRHPHMPPTVREVPTAEALSPRAWVGPRSVYAWRRSRDTGGWTIRCCLRRPV